VMVDLARTDEPDVDVILGVRPVDEPAHARSSTTCSPGESMAASADRCRWPIDDRPHPLPTSCYGSPRTSERGSNAAAGSGFRVAARRGLEPVESAESSVPGADGSVGQLLLPGHLGLAA
jgi:hypothetical protein